MNGVAPYTYHITNAPDTGTAPVSSDVKQGDANEVIEFDPIGVSSGTYNIEITDACKTSFTIPVTMLDLANARIAYLGDAGLDFIGQFCENSEIFLNCVTLGDPKQIDYKWTYPN
jgi:hypothetical protein